MMYLSSKFHISDRFKCLLLGGAFDLLGADVPSEFLLEREDAPRVPGLICLACKHSTTRYAISVMATDRSTLAASLVTCACPKPQPLFNSLKQISTGHLLR